MNTNQINQLFNNGNVKISFTYERDHFTFIRSGTSEYVKNEDGYYATVNMKPSGLSCFNFFFGKMVKKLVKFADMIDVKEVKE